MKKHNKKYAKRMTKREKVKWSQISVLASLIIGAAIIGHTSLIDAYRPEKAISISHRPKLTVQAVKQPKIAQLITSRPDVETQIRQIADKANFTYTDYLIRLMFCESRGNQYAINFNKNGTKDLGLFQINDVHKLSNDFRFDIEKSTKWTINKINSGQQSIWACDKIVKGNKTTLYRKIAEIII